MASSTWRCMPRLWSRLERWSRRKTRQQFRSPPASAFLANAVVWVVFSVAQGNALVLIPNAVGIVLCIVQVALYMIYRPRKTCRSVVGPQGYDSASSSACETVSDAGAVAYVSIKG